MAKTFVAVCHVSKPSSMGVWLPGETILADQLGENAENLLERGAIVLSSGEEIQTLEQAASGGVDIADINTLESKAAALEAFQARNNELADENDKLKLEVESLEENNVDLQKAHDTLVTELAAANEQINEQSAQIALLQTDLSGVKGQLDAANAQILTLSEAPAMPPAADPATPSADTSTDQTKKGK